MNVRLWCVAILGPALVAGNAAAQSREPEEPRGHDSGEGLDPLRGSVFVFDQSLSTQGAHLEPSPQLSYVPFYGWWLSLRPRWNFTPKLRLQARFDYYKEFTNSQATTYRSEDVFDDLWTEIVYASPVAEHGPWSRTTWSVGGRALWPTSKQSRGAGVYVTLGAFAGITEDVPIRGGYAAYLNSARFGLRAGYRHPFSTATTPTSYGTFNYVRQDIDGQTFVDDQLSGQTLVDHELYFLAEGSLQITPRLSFGVSLVWIDQWHYPPSSGSVGTETGRVDVPRIGDQQFTQLIWDVFALDYALIPEASLSLGYYNLTNSIAPDGQVRSPFAAGENNALWSPDAHVFFAVTANLDAIFEDATGRARWGQERATQVGGGDRVTHVATSER